MKKLFTTWLALLSLLAPTLALAAYVTVPTAPGSGYTLVSTAGGGYTTTLSSVSGGNLFGVGTSSPWAILSVASSTYNYQIPLLVVSTSTSPLGRLFNIEATSTILSMQSRASATNENIQGDNGTRISVGQGLYLGGGSVLDQLHVEGRINEGSWHLLKCYPALGNSQIGATTDTAYACGDFSFAEDNNGSLLFNQEKGTQYARISFSNVNPDDGVTLYAGSNSALNFDIASTTPVMESFSRISSPQNASTSNFFIGFTGILPSSTTFELNGTGAGCFFNASTTQANWWATCSTGTATTTVDTGFASSTNVTATGDFYLFRIEVSSAVARFYMGSAATTTRLVANITSNIPTGSGQLVSPQVTLTKRFADPDSEFDIASLRLWIRSLGAFGF